MAAKKFIIELDDQERARLCTLISKGKAPAKVILKARILLKADQAEGGPAWQDARIVEALSQCSQDGPRATTTSTSATVSPTCSCCSRH